MSAPKTSHNWLNKSQQKVLKSNAKAATKHLLSILVIGSPTWCAQLCDALIEYHESNNTSKIEVHKASSVKSALSTLPNIYVDLVVILLDIRKDDCLVDLEINLLSLEPAFLCGRTVLINPRNDIKRKDMGVSYENIDRLKRKYDLLIIHGNIENYLNRMFLSRRIMVFCSRVYNSGLPNILNFKSIDK